MLKQGRTLIELVKAKFIAVAHFAPPCQTQTWGRIPALRSWEFPYGMQGLSGRKLDMVLLGNAIADFVANMCLELYNVDGFFSGNTHRDAHHLGNFGSRNTAWSSLSRSKYSRVGPSAILALLSTRTA